MPVYELKCTDCKHVYFNFTTPCSKKLIKERCPLCGGSKIKEKIVELPPGKKWGSLALCKKKNN